MHAVKRSGDKTPVGEDADVKQDFVHPMAPQLEGYDSGMTGLSAAPVLERHNSGATSMSLGVPVGGGPSMAPIQPTQGQLMPNAEPYPPILARALHAACKQGEPSMQSLLQADGDEEPAQHLFPHLLNQAP